MDFSLPQEECLSLEGLLAWLGEARAPEHDPGVFHESYLLYHPRTLFLKTLAENGTCLDVGAGEGNLPIFQRWPGFVRDDLKFLGVSLSLPPGHAHYVDFAVCNLDDELPSFQLAPNAAVLSQFIEHVQDRSRIFAWLADIIPKGGHVYIEWPSFHTQYLPRLRDVLAEGYDLMTINFFDDSTHKQPIAASSLAEELGGHGFRVQTVGMIDMPYVADRLRDCGVAMKDSYYLTIAVWLKTLFASYIIATRS